MSSTMRLKSSSTELLYDVTSLVSDVSYSTTLKGQAGKLTFTMQNDPNEILDFDIGSIIEFENEDEKVFKGTIFTIELSPSSNYGTCYKIVAYDEMRYLQNHGFYVIKKGSTVKDIFNDICKMSGVKDFGIDESSVDNAESFTLESHTFADTSYFEMLEYVFKRSYPDLLRETESMGENRDLGELIALQIMDKFIVYDDFGKLTLGQVSNLNTNLILGDCSLMTDFSVVKSIDKDTYNDIIITQGKVSKKDEPKTDIKPQHEEMDKDSISKIGVLTKVINVKENATLENIKNYAKSVLDAKSRPTNELKISALGYNGIYAGRGVTINILRNGIFKGLFMKDYENTITMRMYVETATHNYDNGVHTMELELNMGESLI